MSILVTPEEMMRAAERAHEMDHWVPGVGQGGPIKRVAHEMMLRVFGAMLGGERELVWADDVYSPQGADELKAMFEKLGYAFEILEHYTKGTPGWGSPDYRARLCVRITWPSVSGPGPTMSLVDAVNPEKWYTE